MQHTKPTTDLHVPLIQTRKDDGNIGEQVSIKFLSAQVESLLLTKNMSASLLSWNFRIRCPYSFKKHLGGCTGLTNQYEFPCGIEVPVT